MKRLHDALCSVVQRLPMAELARIIERDPRSARRWVQVLVGQKRLADLSVVAVLHLARHEARTYGSSSIADAFRELDEATPETGPVHPADLQAFVRKARAGADSAITQYFFNSDAYFRFVDDLRRLGVDIPVVPGIMPITSSTQLMRFSDACGAEIPRWIRLRLQAFGDDSASIRSFGLDVVSDLCARLRDAGAPALHFYTMNQAAATTDIVRRLGLAGDRP